jgi:hemoglobin
MLVVMAEPASRASVRLALTEAASSGPIRATGITPDTIALIVDEFYAECRRDPVLGPVFERHVDSWDEHLARVRTFWSSALLRSGQYSGRPLEAHLAIPGLAPEHFTHWLRLFSQTVSKHCSPQDAAAFMALAGRMARVIVANSDVRKDSGAISTSNRAATHSAAGAHHKEQAGRLHRAPPAGRRGT